MLRACWPRPLAQDTFIVVASTTSTEQSGCSSTAAGLREGHRHRRAGGRRRHRPGARHRRRGDADVVFVHDKAAEDQWLAEATA
jgi:tungstate transport system substrate-binding protein